MVQKVRDIRKKYQFGKLQSILTIIHKMNFKILASKNVPVNIYCVNRVFNTNVLFFKSWWFQW
jgi:hypothetical protein